MVSDLFTYPMVLYSIFISTLFYGRNPSTLLWQMLALTPELKKAVPPSKESQSKCKIRANSWMWADTQYLVCGTSLTLLDVNCSTLSVSSEMFNGLDPFQLPWEQCLQPQSAGFLLPGPAELLPISAHGLEAIPEGGEESCPKYSSAERCGDMIEK